MDVDFIKYLTESKKLIPSSIGNYKTRMKIMHSRNIDFTKGEDNARKLLLNSDLAPSTVSSCLTICRKYTDYLQAHYLS
ncbi:MAG TPA: hypothetical protein VIK86_06920 [Candidatus Paceibacterota bacterium]